MLKYILECTKTFSEIYEKPQKLDIFFRKSSVPFWNFKENMIDKILNLISFIGAKSNTNISYNHKKLHILPPKCTLRPQFTSLLKYSNLHFPVSMVTETA